MPAALDSTWVEVPRPSGPSEPTRFIELAALSSCSDPMPLRPSRLRAPTLPRLYKVRIISWAAPAIWSTWSRKMSVLILSPMAPFR